MQTIHATAFLEGLGRHSLTAAIVIGLALAARAVAFRGPAARWRTALWTLVFVRLLVPAMPASRWSVMNAGEWWAARAKVGVEKPVLPMVDGTARQVELHGFLPPERMEATVAPAIQRVEMESRWPSILVGLWVAGAIGVIGRRAVAHFLFLRKVKAGAVVTDGKLADMLREACDRIGVRRAPMLRLTDVTGTPALAGLVRPQLLLPPAVVESLSPAQLRLVMLHELAHLRRGDLWVDLFLTLVLAMHWFNPMAWLAAALYRSDREIVRDAMVLRAAGEKASQDYGRTIVMLVERLALSGRTPIGAVGILERWGGIGQRIRAVVDRRRPGVVGVGMAVVGVLVIGCAGMTDRAKPQAGVTAPVEVKPSPAVEAALQRKLATIYFYNEPLSKVIEKFRAEAGVPVLVKWNLLKQAGVSRDSPIRLNAKDITIAHALNTALWDAPADAGFRIRYGFFGDGIVISTAADLDAAEMTTRSYEIKDLLIDIPDFDNAPAMGMMPTTRPVSGASQLHGEKLLTHDERVQQIIKLVRETVDPSSWYETATIGEHSDRLVVRQSPANHAQLEGLFGQLRETRGLQITVEARFITLDPSAGDIDTVLKNLGVIKKPEKGSSTRPSLEGAYLDEDQVRDVIKRSEAHDSVLREAAAPRMTVFNGQRGWLMVATSHAYIADTKVVRGKDGSVGYEPKMDQVNSGYLLDVQATVSADRKWVTMTLRPQVSRLERMEEMVFDPNAAAGADGKRPMIQRPVVSASAMQTTVSVPNGGTLLMAGFSPVGKAATRTVGGERVLLLVRPTIIVSRDERGKDAGR